MITGARYDKLEAISDEVAKASRNGALTRDLYRVRLHPNGADRAES